MPAITNAKLSIKSFASGQKGEKAAILDISMNDSNLEFTSGFDLLWLSM